MSNGHTFTASYEYRDGEGQVVGTTINFRDRGPDLAIRSSVRWWNARHEAAPEWFAELLCIKLGFLNIGPIDETGRLSPPYGGTFFEYKCDTAGAPLDDYVENRILRMWAEKHGKPVRSKKGAPL